MREIAFFWRECDRTVKSVMASTLAMCLGLTCFAGKILYDSYQTSLASAEAQTAMQKCTPLDKTEIARRTQIILAAALKQPTNISRNENETRLLAIGGTYKLPFLSTQPFAYEIDTAKDATQAVAIADKATTTYFGFRTTATINPKNPEQTRTDARHLMSILDTTPIDLAKTVRLDEVRLGSPEPAKRKVYDTTAAAFTNRTFNDSEWRVITIGPGQVGNSFTHELGHQVQWQYSAKTCGSAHIPDYHDPDFTAANPAGFQYQYPAQNWPGVTRNWYPATGLPEDQADSLDALMTPDGGCQGAQSATIAQKLGVISMHLDILQPQMGAHTLDTFVHYCTTNVPK